MHMEVCVYQISATTDSNLRKILVSKFLRSNMRYGSCSTNITRQKQFLEKILLKNRNQHITEMRLHHDHLEQFEPFSNTIKITESIYNV